jgi:putative ABC transport system permease protein
MQTEAIARLRPGVTTAAAGEAMHALAATLKRQHRAGMGPRGEDGGFDIAVVALREEMFAASRSILLALSAGSAVLLLLAMANTALLWLGRAASRRREAELRLALGAPRLRIAQQMTVEALLPSLAGGALGLAISTIVIGSVKRAALAELAVLDGLSVDLRAFGGAIALSALAGILFGVLPLWAILRGRQEPGPLRGSRGEAGDRNEARLRPALIAVQAGLSAALLAPSLLLVQSLRSLERVDPGFRTDGLLTAYTGVPPGTDAESFARHLMQQLERWPGSGRATVASNLPLTFGAGGDPFSIEGRVYGASGTTPQFAHAIRVGEGFFRLMRIPILSGRALERSDFGPGAPHVAIVNDTLARAFWPQESPIGKRIVMGAPRPGVPWMTIVGIARDIHSRSLSAAPIPQIYRPLTQAPSGTLAAIVEEPATGAELAHTLRAVDTEAPAYSIATMDERVRRSIQRPRFGALLFSAYGLLAFLLAAFGVYSLASYTAARRRREFAVRTALGAAKGQLLGAMVGRTLRPAVAGVMGGVAGGHAIARIVSSLLYRTETTDAAIFAITAAVVCGVAAGASALASRGVLSMDPAEVLRHE